MQKSASIAIGLTTPELQPPPVEKRHQSSMSRSSESLLQRCGDSSSSDGDHYTETSQTVDRKTSKLSRKKFQKPVLSASLSRKKEASKDLRPGATSSDVNTEDKALVSCGQPTVHRPPSWEQPWRNNWDPMKLTSVHDMVQSTSALTETRSNTTVNFPVPPHVSKTKWKSTSLKSLPTRSRDAPAPPGRSSQSVRRPGDAHAQKHPEISATALAEIAVSTTSIQSRFRFWRIEAGSWWGWAGVRNDNDSVRFCLSRIHHVFTVNVIGGYLSQEHFATRVDCSDNPCAVSTCCTVGPIGPWGPGNQSRPTGPQAQGLDQVARTY